VSAARGNVAGAALLAGAMTLFNAGDTFVKLLSERLPILEVVAARNLLAAGLVLIAWAARPGLLRPAHLIDRGVIARAALDTCTTLLYLLGVSLLPLAEAATLLFVSPLLGTALAGLVLRERVGPLRWLAVAAGFAGVLLVAQPGTDGWRPAALLPLAAACFMAVADIVTRRIDPAVGPASVVLTNLMAVAIAAGLWAVLDPQPLAATDLPALLAASGFLLAGYLAYVAAFRLGEVSFVAPFKYAGLPAAALLGWLVWGDVPNGLALAGMGLIVGWGLMGLAGVRRGGFTPEDGRGTIEQR
jgi:drug/metabolite transporter (DMT)-like permease